MYECIFACRFGYGNFMKSGSLCTWFRHVLSISVILWYLNAYSCNLLCRDFSVFTIFSQIDIFVIWLFATQYSEWTSMKCQVKQQWLCNNWTGRYKYKIFLQLFWRSEKGPLDRFMKSFLQMCYHTIWNLM